MPSLPVHPPACSDKGRPSQSFSHFVICSSIIAISSKPILKCASASSLKLVAASATSQKTSKQQIFQGNSCDKILLRRSPFTLCWLKPLPMPSATAG